MKESIVKIDSTELDLSDKLINVNRVAKVVSGGKRLSFSALVVAGDGNGHVGIGVGKANEVPAAVNKGGVIARKNLISVPIKGTTIPHEIKVKFGAAKVLLKPAAPGTGIIAGSSIRAVLQAVGIQDVLTKSLGSSNRINMAKATIIALSSLREPKVEIARRRASPSSVGGEAES